MDQATVTLIVGVTTVAMSGVISSFVTFKLSKSKEQQTFMRSKAEQLYLATDEYGKAFFTTFVGHFQLLDGRIDYNQMLDLQIANGEKDRKHGGAETMTMLVEIYFPTAKDALDNVWKSRADAAAVRDQIKEYYRRFGEATDPNLKVAFLQTMNAVEESITGLQNEIIQTARHHAGERIHLPKQKMTIKKMILQRFFGK